MCYKNEVLKKNAEKLQRKFKEVYAPKFLRDYFYTLNSEAGKLNNGSVIIGLLNWLIAEKRIDKDSIAELTEEDMQKITKTHIIIYLEELLKKEGLKPSTIETKKNILSGFWKNLVDEDIVNKNIIRSIPKTKFKTKKKNNAKSSFAGRFNRND